MAFVPDISGVCSVLGTLEITSKPTKAESTKTVMSERMSPPFIASLLGAGHE